MHKSYTADKEPPFVTFFGSLNKLLRGLPS